MGALFIPAIVRLLPWILAWIALGGNVKSVEQNIEGFGQAIVQGPITSATNAWVKVAVIAAALGFGVWILESKVAKGMGQEVSAPPVASIPVAAPPTFGTSGGYSASAGPLTVDSRVTASGGGHSGGGYGSPGRPLSDRTGKRAASRSSKVEPIPIRRASGFSDEEAA